MALKIIKSVKKVPSIKFMIHRNLAGWEKARSHEHIHASDLMQEDELCPREWILLDITQRARKDRFIGTALRMTFDHGRSVEWNIRNKYLRDVVVGNWKCMVCDHEHNSFGKVPKIKCPKCGFHKWEYDEVRFHDEFTGVSGGIDTLVDVGETKLRIIEIKSMDKDEFKGLIAPLAEHRFRTSLYLKLAEKSSLKISNRVNTQEAHILYVSKSFGFKDETLKEEGITDAAFSPFKEFIIPRDDSLAETPLAKARLITVLRETPTLGIPAGVCKNALEKRASKCSCVTACFGTKYPPTLTWVEQGKPRHEGKKVVDLGESE